MEPAPAKRGRGRPRKSAALPAPAIEPEEVIIMAPPDVGDSSEEEVIELQGYSRPEPEPEEPEPATVQHAVVPPQRQPESPQIVYVTQEPAVNESRERARRHAALQRIKKYRESFEAVAAMPFSETWSTDQLESHLESVRACVSAKTTGLLVKGAYLAGVKGLEVATTSVGIKSYGITQILSQSAEIDSLLKEIACECGIGHIPATTRLALATLQTIFVLDSTNRRAEALAGFKAEPVNVELKGKYSDL